MNRWTSFGRDRLVDPAGQRVIGLSEDRKSALLGIRGHSLCLAPNGAGKTTCVAMPAIFSFASQTKDALLVFDGKEGELAAQCAQMLSDMGRTVYVIDDFDRRPELAQYKISLNPFGASVASFRQDPRDVIFANDALLQTLIPNPKNDERNEYFRAWPQRIIEFAHNAMLSRDADAATPGAAAKILSDEEMLTALAQIEAEEKNILTVEGAEAINGMRSHEHWPQHLEKARRALRAFSPGTRLNDVGQGATKTHADLIREGAVVFLVGPQARMRNLSSYYALHIMSFCDALYAGAGVLRAICDEFTNMPLKELVEALTTLRAYGGEFHMIAQSRSEIIRKYGEQECETIEENAVVKIWRAFTSFKEAERVSKAMGEEHAVASGLGLDSESLKASTNLSLIKQPRMSPAELLALPADMQLVHMRGIGFFLCPSVSQANIAPFCNLLADNPLEGGRLPPDPKITLKTP
ncbi:MAG: type IV secretory system conjugative DNA transfer family protein [Pseudomonadota bacterium]